MSDGGACCARTPAAAEKTSKSSRGRMGFRCDNPKCGRCQSNRSRTMDSSALDFVPNLDLLEAPSVQLIGKLGRDLAGTVAGAPGAIGFERASDHNRNRESRVEGT